MSGKRHEHSQDVSGNIRETANTQSVKRFRSIGRENFTIETLEVCQTREQANEREKYWITFYNCISPNGYNLTDGGNVCEFSEEAHLNMSAGQKRCYSNPAEHKKSSKAQKKRAQTPEGRADLLAACEKAKKLAEIKRRERESKLPAKNPRKSETARNRAATPEGHANIMKAVAKSLASRATKRGN